MKEILAQAITRGGTTFRDFQGPDGRPGYFVQELFVYGREGEPCLVCGSLLHGTPPWATGASVWCSRCQK